MLQGLGVQAGLAAEMVLDQGGVGLGPPGDLADARAVEPLFRETQDGCFQEADPGGRFDFGVRHGSLKKI